MYTVSSITANTDIHVFLLFNSTEPDDTDDRTLLVQLPRVSHQSIS